MGSMAEDSVQCMTQDDPRWLAWGRYKLSPVIKNMKEIDLVVDNQHHRIQYQIPTAFMQNKIFEAVQMFKM